MHTIVARMGVPQKGKADSARAVWYALQCHFYELPGTNLSVRSSLPRGDVADSSRTSLPSSAA